MKVMGTDRVIARETSRVVYAQGPMEGWEVRDYRRAAIRYEGERYYVARNEPWGRGGRRYVLEPWPEDSWGDDPVCEIAYDQELVSDRDEALRRARRGQLHLPLVALARPFTGVLWSSWKRRLHERYGLHPRRVTEISLWIQYALFVLCGGLASISVMGTIYGGEPVLPTRPLLVLGALIGVDAVARYSALQTGTMDPPGFCEWLLRRPRLASI